MREGPAVFEEEEVEGREDRREARCEEENCSGPEDVGWVGIGRGDGRRRGREEEKP